MTNAANNRGRAVLVAVAMIRLTAARYAAENLPDMPGIRRIEQDRLAVTEALLSIAEEAEKQHHQGELT